jgi:DNA-binding PadR family transcriptional regulator
MTSKEFIIWLKGFIAGSNNYNLTPSGWEALKRNLELVDGVKIPPCVGHDNASWDEEVAERRMDIIGQNGNEGLHYDINEEYENFKIY